MPEPRHEHGCPPPALLGALFAVSALADGTERITGLAPGLEALLALSGAPFLSGLVDYLASTLGADAALVAEVAGGHRLRTVAMRQDGRMVPPGVDAAAGDPWEEVLARGACTCLDGGEDARPGGVMAWPGMRAYVGQSLACGADPPCGLMAVMYRHALGDATLPRILLQLLAPRVAVELERCRADGESYRLLVEHQAEPVVRLDAAGRLLFASPSCCRTCGRGPAELIGQQILTLLHEDDRAAMAQALAAVLGPPWTAALEARTETREGWRWFAWSFMAVRDAEGTVSAMVGVGRDLTDRKRAELEAQRREDRLRSIIEASPMGLHLYRLMPDGRLVFMSSNAAADALLRCDQRTLIGRTIEEAFPALAEADLAPCSRELCRDGTPWHSEQVALQDSRGPRTFEVHAFSIAADALAVMFLEITARQRAEAELSASRMRLAGIIDSAMDAIIATDEEGTIQLFNGAAERVFGSPAAAMLGRPAAGLIPERLQGELLGQLRSFLLSGDASRSVQLIACRTNGEEFPAEVSIAQVASEGGRMFTVMLRDVTDRCRLEAQLRQAQRLESIGRLAGGIAHDFNNLLSPVLGYVELILAEPGHDERRRERLTQVHGAADRARVLVRQLLAFSSKQVLSPRILSLGAVAANCEHILRRTIREYVHIGFSIDPDAGQVMADMVQIEQVMMNLAVNAQDAMPDGGCMEVAVRAGRADEEAQAGGPCAVLEVADSGSGMTAEVREHLFEPFFTTKGNGCGTGLGLAAVYGIVSQHGGRILVDSEPGRGSRFRVLLPRIDRPEDADSGPHPCPGRPGQGRVLVVEDDDLVRRLTVEALREHGYEVEGVAGPQAALAFLDRTSSGIELLLTDVVMPEMDGFELHQLAVQRHPGLKVLYMSGYTDSDLVPDEVSEHPDCFLAKPFTIFALTDKVKGMMARQA